MVNFFIYSGLGIMLLGALYGLCIAVKGYLSRIKSGENRSNIFNGFMPGNVSSQMRKLIRTWGIIMIAGAILTGIGLALGLK